jgi:hypothetical protein
MIIMVRVQDALAICGALLGALTGCAFALRFGVIAGLVGGLGGVFGGYVVGWLVYEGCVWLGDSIRRRISEETLMRHQVIATIVVFLISFGLLQVCGIFLRMFFKLLRHQNG